MENIQTIITYNNKKLKMEKTKKEIRNSELECPKCGSKDVHFDVASKKWVCSHCGHKF